MATTRSVARSGRKTSVKVSGHMTTVVSLGSRSTARGRSPRMDLRSPPAAENRGAGRFVAMPAIRLSARPTSGAPRAPLAMLATAGHVVVSRPAQGMRPMAYMAAGRAGPCSSGRGTPTCRWPCRHGSGSPRRTPCRTGRARGLLAPLRSATSVAPAPPGTARPATWPVLGSIAPRPEWPGKTGTSWPCRPAGSDRPRRSAEKHGEENRRPWRRSKRWAAGAQARSASCSARWRPEGRGRPPCPGSSGRPGPTRP